MFSNVGANVRLVLQYVVDDGHNAVDGDISIVVEVLALICLSRRYGWGGKTIGNYRHQTVLGSLSEDLSPGMLPQEPQTFKGFFSLCIQTSRRSAEVTKASLLVTFIYRLNMSKSHYYFLRRIFFSTNAKSCCFTQLMYTANIKIVYRFF